MTEFLEYKLQRALWYAFLEQEKLPEAIENFEAYKRTLSSLNEKSKFYKEVQKELDYSAKLFIKKIKELSVKYTNNKKYSDALICYKYIFEQDKNNKENILNYIKCLEKLELFDLQLDLSIYLNKKDKSPENLKLLSKAFEKNNNFKEAIKYYNKYLKKINKTQPDAADYNTLGCHYFNSYVKNGQNPLDAQNALTYFKKTLEEAPESKTYLKNTIVAAMKAKDYETEKQCWSVYIKNGYHSKEDEFTYSASCLRNGDIEEWEKYYGSRFLKNEPTIYPNLNKPEWTGNENIKNKILLVHYEQGYGDNFLMFGYMPRLTKLAKKVIYYIQNNAYELVKNNDYGVEVHCRETAELKDLQFDYHIPCMSIPTALKLNKENISVNGGYIRPDKELVQKFKEDYFNNDKFKIGIAFEGISSNSKRDIPLKKLLPLDKLQNIEIYCFTKDIEDKKLNCFKNNKIINIAKDFNNFADTAAAIENTDVILSSDNCILNLAGAIGKRTIGIFNYHYEFRWYDLTGEDCGWYKSVHPIVNNEYNDWDISVKKAVDLIKEYMSV